jgi:uncharacterized SAM-binding protein YcdF (DUF218 family)
LTIRGGGFVGRLLLCSVPTGLGFKLFFLLSKTLGNALVPVNFLIGIGLLGAVLSAIGFFSLARGLLITAAVLLAVAAFSPAGRLLLYPLESRFPPWTPGERAPDGIIVLGGSIDADVSLARNMPVVRHSPDRIIAAAALARQYPNARVVFTGGSPRLVSDSREADYAAAIFESLGVDRSRLSIERQSRNTEENAEFTKALVAPKPGERWVLVTSAYHMPRSIGMFRKVGFPVEAYPIDRWVGGWRDAFSFTALALEGLSRTDIAMREWFGLVAYRVTGRIDNLLPGADDH